MHCAWSITSNLTAEKDGLVSSLYGGAIVERYPYDNVVVYHVGRKTSQPLRSADEARRYLGAHAAERDAGCPRGREGHGVPVS